MGSKPAQSNRDALIVKALDILDRPIRRAPEKGDQLPKGYLIARRKNAGKSS